MTTNVAITGCTGRMGLALLQASREGNHINLTAALAPADSPEVGHDVGELLHTEPLGVSITDDINTAIASSDVLIDFTRPEATLSYLQACVKAGRAMVIGTTGFSEDELQQIAEAAKQIPIVHAPNMSVGVNLCFNLLQQAAKILGDDYDVEVIEAHHRHKVDAPSGTALRMGEVVAEALDRNFNTCSVHGRHGQTGERGRKTIGFSAIRAGEIVGDHTVLFAGQGERIEITHRASDRIIYAKGALRAASWLQNQPPGLYSMQDVLAT